MVRGLTLGHDGDDIDAPTKLQRVDSIVQLLRYIHMDLVVLTTYTTLNGSRNCYC